jgi:cytoskeletal protein CcmA (bactofilin family)
MANLDSSRIGRGVVVRGTIRGDGDLEVEGRVEGTVDVDGELTLADSARVKIEGGALSGRRVVIQGAVLGDVRGSASIVLDPGARVVGDLAAPSIGIRPGGLLRGHVSTDGAAPANRGASRSAPRREEAPARAPARVPPPRREAPAPRETPAPKPAPKSKGAPPPVMPALKKGAKAQMKKKAGK